MSNIIKLLSAFNHIAFIEDGHKYIDSSNNKQYTSVTSILGSLKDKFDSRFWTVYKSFEYSGYKVKDNFNGTLTVIAPSETVMGHIVNPYFSDLNEFDLTVTPDDVARDWALTSRIGKTRGTLVHEYLENLLKRKQTKISIPQFIQSLPIEQVITYMRSINKLKTMAEKFVEDITKTHTVILQEFVVGDTDYEIAGTFDLLLFNNVTEKFELWDFKTDKKFTTKGRNKLSYFGIQDCELNKYSLQLGIYKHLIQKHTDIEIDKSFIAYFNYKENDNYQIIECLNYDNEINSFLQDGKNKPTRI